MQRAGGNPCICCLNRSPLSTGLPGNLGPPGTDFPASRKYDELRQVLRQLRSAQGPPVSFELPPLQLRQCHEGNPEKAPADVAPVVLRSRITLEKHRHYIGVDDGGIHWRDAAAVPSRRQSRSIAANASGDSSSAEASPSRASKSVTGGTPCDAASSSKDALSDNPAPPLVASLSTVAV